MRQSFLHHLQASRVLLNWRQTLVARCMTELEIKPSRAAVLRATAVVAVALAIGGTLVFLLAGGGAALFENKVNISTYMPDATGLGLKSQVRIGGLVVGKVSNVEITRYLDPARAVRVDMRVSSRYLPFIPLDSLTGIRSDTLVGFKFVSILQGKSTSVAGDRTFLTSEPLQVADDRADLVRTLQNELKDVDALVASVASPTSPMGKYVFGDAEYRNLMEGTRTFSAAVREFSDPSGWAGSMVFQSTMYDQIRSKVLATEKDLAAVASGEGAAGRLLNDPKSYDDIVIQLKSLRTALQDINDGKGDMGAFVATDAGHRKIEALLKATDKMLAPLDAKEGAAAALLRDPKLYQSLNKTLHTVDELMKSFHQNPDKFTKGKIKF